ncbi:MAG: hypothetical protein QXN37_03245 [Candidatus Anstonellaceae archaeon]
MRSIFFIFLFFCLSFASQFGQEPKNNDTLDSSKIHPPSIPDVRNTLSFQAVFSNGTPASQVHLAFLARTNRSETIYRTITDPSGKFMLSLQNGSYQIDALIDLPSTPGIDFASTSEISVPNEGNLTLIFHPSGSLYGHATNLQFPVPSALVKVSYPSSSFDYSRINGGRLCVQMNQVFFFSAPFL